MNTFRAQSPKFDYVKGGFYLGLIGLIGTFAGVIIGYFAWQYPKTPIVASEKPTASKVVTDTVFSPTPNIQPSPTAEPKPSVQESSVISPLSSPENNVTVIKTPTPKPKLTSYKRKVTRPEIIVEESDEEDCYCEDAEEVEDQ